LGRPEIGDVGLVNGLLDLQRFARAVETGGLDLQRKPEGGDYDHKANADMRGKPD